MDISIEQSGAQLVPGVETSVQVTAGSPLALELRIKDFLAPQGVQVDASIKLKKDFFLAEKDEERREGNDGIIKIASSGPVEMHHAQVIALADDVMRPIGLIRLEVMAPAAVPVAHAGTASAPAPTPAPAATTPSSTPAAPTVLSVPDVVAKAWKLVTGIAVLVSVIMALILIPWAFSYGLKKAVDVWDDDPPAAPATSQPPPSRPCTCEPPAKET